jgi:flagellar biosynthetic protein FliR
VSAIAPDTILAVFAIFCRVGACLMVAPGFSSSQVPTRARLFVALAVSLALSALLVDTIRPAVADGSPVGLVSVIFTELAIGLFLGFLIRLLFAALQFIAIAITQSIGLSALPGTVIEETDQIPPLATLFTVTATTLMFVAGLHGELLRGLVQSYAAIPPGRPFQAQPMLIDVANRAGTIFVAALRIGSPFIVFSVLVNFAIGVTNKLTPQIPVFFIATPFMIMGGLVLLLFTVHDFFAYFMIALTSIVEGG